MLRKGFLYLVIHRGSLSLEEVYNKVCLGVEGGVALVQLRDKQASAREIVHLRTQLLSFLRPRNIPLIINDRADLAHAIGADGVHLGQSNLTASKARALLGKRALIGLSIESSEQAVAAFKEEVDYIAASPVFPSTTKLDCAHAWGLEGLKQLCALSPHPVVALGGIDKTTIKHVIECSVAGIAVSAALFNASCPKTTAIQLIQEIRSYET